MAEIWNLSALCRCCLKDGYFSDLDYPYMTNEGSNVGYSAWLQETFRITLSTPCIPASNMICEECVSSLSAARRFRTQVELSERQFQEYCTNEATTVKVEPPDDPAANYKKTNNVNKPYKIPIDDIKLKMELLSDNDDASNNFDDHHQDIDEKEKIIQSEVKMVFELTPYIGEKGSAGDKKNTVKNPAPSEALAKPLQNQKIVAKTKKKSVEKGKNKKADTKIKGAKKTEEKRKCKKCDLVCRTSHVKNHQSGNKNTCSFCCKTFRTASKFNRHLRRHYTSKKQFTCDYCQHEFKTRYNLILHIKKHLGTIATIPCHVCGRVFYNATFARQHVEQVHEKIHPYQCEYCAKNYKVKRRLLEHIRRAHTADRPYVCTACSCRFVTGYELNLHVKQHRCGETVAPTANYRIRAFKCHICSTIMNSRSEHRKHLNELHNGDLPYPCGNCPKGFLTKNVWRRHRMTHGIGDAFTCNICLRHFASSSRLENHKREHTSEKSVTVAKEGYKRCEICKHLVKDMETHKKRHFNRPFQCELCPKNFAMKNALTRHIKDTHLRQYGYQCDICLRRFVRMSGVLKHRAKKHPEGPKVPNCAFKIKPEEQMDIDLP